MPDPSPDVFVLANMAPRQRLMVLLAWVFEDGDKCFTDARRFTVYGVETVRVDGVVIHSPQFIVGGRCTSLWLARQTLWPATAVDRVICCTWKKRDDPLRLPPRLEKLRRLAWTRERRRRLQG